MDTEPLEETLVQNCKNLNLKSQPRQGYHGKSELASSWLSRYGFTFGESIPLQVRGYLANDVLGNPLLPPGYGAHCPDAVGKRVSNGVVKATKEETAARKAAKEAARAVARKGGAVDADAVEKAAQAALAAKYDLQLPGVGRRVQHKTPALMSPHELAMAGLDAPEQTLEQLQQAVEQAVQLWLALMSFWRPPAAPPYPAPRSLLFSRARMHQDASKGVFRCPLRACRA